MTEGELILDFADALNKIQVKKNISTWELSEKTGIERALIYKYKAGFTWPGTKNLTLILNALGVSVYEFWR